MHVSVHSSKNHYDNERAWALPGKNVIAQTPPSPEVPEGADEPGTRPTLRLGATGDLVKIAQRLLHQRIDGTFGPLLEAATKGFQRGTNIDVDGIIGTDTWNELDELEQDNAPEHWHENITATVFGGKKDPNQSAYERRQITDLELGVALPFRFKGERPQVIVEHRTTGKQAICEIVDVGPWNTDDPYWVNKARPQAESGTDKRGRKTNKAGIDLTPGAAKAIGLGGLGQVNWSFVGTQDEGEPS
jgi:hypothetical protein